MHRFAWVLVALALLWGAGVGGNLYAASVGLFNTGACSGANAGTSGCTGGLLPVGDNDANWLYMGYGVTTLTPSIVVAPIGGPNGWVPADGLSEWLEPAGGGSVPAPTQWTAQTTYSLAGFIPSSLVLDISVAVDNFVGSTSGSPSFTPTTFAVNIDGTTVDGFTPACYGGPGTSGTANCYAQFSSTTISNSQIAGGYLAGNNTLQLVITNQDNPSPTGFRVEITDNVTAITPEPATWMLLAGGLGVIALMRRKR